MELKEEYEEEMKESHKSSFTYLDLVKYASLRGTTIVLTFLFLFSSVLYFAPLTIVDQFGFDFFLNGIILNCSELLTYFLSLNVIVSLERKRLFFFNLVISLGCAVALIFLNKR